MSNQKLNKEEILKEIRSYMTKNNISPESIGQDESNLQVVNHIERIFDHLLDLKLVNLSHKSIFIHFVELNMIYGL